MGKRLDDIWEKLLLFQEKMDKIIESIDSKYNNCHLILPFDIIEYDTYIVIKIDAPGIEENDFKIYFDDNLLIVEGIKFKSESGANKRYLIAERKFGKFRNIIEIPNDFDIQKINYFIQNGVIFIKINKK